MYSGEIAPDRADTAFSDGVHAMFEPDETHTWGGIAAWAWGLSRTLDMLEKLTEVEKVRREGVSNAYKRLARELPVEKGSKMYKEYLMERGESIPM